MRRTIAVLASAGVLGCGGGAATGSGGASGGITSTTTTGSDGGGGTGGSIPAGCIPSENVDAVADTCGVFVSSSLGDNGNTGTKDKPLKTLAAALAAAKGKPVYACGEGFGESVSIAASATLYGALDCAKGWVYDAAKKTQVSGSADAVAMVINKATTSAEVFDFVIASPNATKDGGSSIAVLVAQASASFTRCDVVAGSGKVGAAGGAQSQLQTPATANGTDGGDNAACTVTTIIQGGPGGTNTCDGTMTDGGRGGKGLPASTGDQGVDGLPMMTPGNGGSGQTSGSSCKAGQQGADGGVAPPGTGARGIGDISASGYEAPSATLGGKGPPGQGGGGGGGARQCDVNGMFAGPSGGGGGAGGCGGAPGNPGQSGGSSIGILALSADLMLTNVTITANDGGAGGLGGDGQRGGNGGLVGNAVAAGACPGGPGGQGGAGGPGGGGAGGHSIAMALKGGKMPDLGSTTIQHGNGASGGAGGDMDMTAETKGDDGLGCKSLDFADATSCVK